MPRRPGPSIAVDDVVAAALEVLRVHGAEALTPTRVAAALGIRAPSLYHHVRGAEDLRALVAVEGWRRLVASLPAPVDDPAEALRGLALAYRGWARGNPALYRVMATQPFDPGDARLLEVTASALSALSVLELDGDRAIHALRGLRSVMHGFVDLEIAGQFAMGVSTDESFAWLTEAVIRGALAGR